MIERIYMALKQYPLVIGSGTSILGAILSLLEVLEPHLRFLALLVGLLVGVITGLIKWQEWQIKRLERIRLKKEISNEPST